MPPKDDSVRERICSTCIAASGSLCRARRFFWCFGKAAQAFHNRSPPLLRFDTCKLSNFGGGYEEEGFLFIYRRKESEGK